MKLYYYRQVYLYEVAYGSICLYGDTILKVVSTPTKTVYIDLHSGESLDIDTDTKVHTLVDNLPAALKEGCSIQRVPDIETDKFTSLRRGDTFRYVLSSFSVRYVLSSFSVVSCIHIRTVFGSISRYDNTGLATMVGDKPSNIIISAPKNPIIIMGNLTSSISMLVRRA